MSLSRDSYRTMKKLMKNPAYRLAPAMQSRLLKCGYIEVSRSVPADFPPVEVAGSVFRSVGVGVPVEFSVTDLGETEVESYFYVHLRFLLDEVIAGSALIVSIIALIRSFF